METTRHFTATVYVVSDGAVALHEHDRLGKWLPPGGHVDRDELPHEAGLREVREETGLEPTLVHDTPEIAGDAAMTLPQPRHMVLYDINVHEDGSVGHQHVDHLYFAAVPGRGIVPAVGEEAADAWDWYTPAELRADDGLDADVVALGQEAIETVETALAE